MITSRRVRCTLSHRSAFVSRILIAPALLAFALGSSPAVAQVDVNPAPASYTTLSAAFAAINAGTHTGAVTIAITGDTVEVAPAVLNASGVGAASYTTIVISPSGGATRTISGAIAAGSPLIDLNGADGVTIDGLNTGGNALTISNTTVSATAGTSTIRFIADATNNLVTNATILGSSTMAVGTAGGNIVFSTGTTTGNDANTVSNCNIGPAGANLPTKAVFGLGTTTTVAAGNQTVVINNNNIFDYFGAGVASGGVFAGAGNTDWTITNNRFYQSAIRTFTTGVNHRAIDVQNSASGAGFTITGNTIGFAAANGTGVYSLTGSTGKFAGIVFNGVTGGTASTVSNNTITAIGMTGVTSSGTSTSSPFIGAMLQNGAANSDGNTIGSQTGTGAITFSTNTTTATDVYGLFNFSFDPWTANNNSFGSLTASNGGASGAFILFLMRANTGAGLAFNATGNLLGGTTAASIQNTSTSTTAQIVGIQTPNARCNWTSNTIRNLVASGGTGTTTGASIVGMLNSGTGATSAPEVISQNTISALSNTAGAAATTIIGIQYTGPTTGANLLARNFIHSFNAASATGILTGINITGGTSTFQNNMIRLGVDALGADIVTGLVINGIAETGGTDAIVFNSVYVGGTAVGGTANSFAFSSTVTTNTRSFRDNIFFNARSNGAGTGKHYAIRVGGTTPNPAGLTSDNNILRASGTGGFTGLFNAIDQANLGAWQAATGQDLASLFQDPQLLAPTAALPNLHINSALPSVAEAAGFSIGSVTDDFDGETRAGLTPTDIGADAGNFIFSDQSAPVISYVAFQNTLSTANRTLSATLTDVTGVATGAVAPRIYYRKGAGAYFSQACSLSSGTVNNGTWDCTIVVADLGGVTGSDQISYFVIAQDTLGNIASNPGGATATDVNNVSVPPPAPASYFVSVAYSGTYSVGTGESITSLTNPGGLFALLNAGILTANVTIDITSDLVAETGAVALNQLTEEPVASNFTLTIHTATPVLRTISGAAAAGLIRLNSADRVTFSGLPTKFLLVRNTDAAGPTFLFQNDSTNNTLESIIVEGGTTSTSSGTIVFGTSTGFSGNSFNTVVDSEVRDRTDAPGVPANAIYSSGSAGALNASNQVMNNAIYNWSNGGLRVAAAGAGNSWTVDNNSFYQTAPRTTAMSGLTILGGGGHTVSNNFVGGTAPGAAGSHLNTSQTFRGIDLAVTNAPTTTVATNIVRNIRSTYPAADFASSYGILLQSGGANILGNTVGSANVAERYEISGDSFAMRVLSTFNVTVANNTVNNFTTAPNPPTGEFYFGLSVEGTGLVASILGNTITNVTNGSVPDPGFNTQTIGLYVPATGVQTVRGNTISNIGSTSLAAPASLNNRVWGLIMSGNAVGSLVEQNLVTNVYGSSAGLAARADVITGIQSQSVSNATYSNNMVSLDGGAAPSDRPIFAMLDLSASPAANNYYYNSANVFGTASGINNSYAFNRNNTATVSIKDNIFVNQRVTAGGFAIAMANSNAAATGWSATASNYNRLHTLDSAQLTQWLGGAFNLAGFQAASGGDANTTAGNPLFVSNTDLHLQVTSPVLGLGTPLAQVTIDFDGQLRPLANTDVGADEILSADLSITKDDGVTGVLPGAQTTYTITATNNGTSDVVGATVTDNFPAGIASCLTSCVPSPGSFCVAGQFAGNIDDTVNLLVGGTVTYTSVCNVSPSATGTLDNTASVEAPVGIIDPDSSNDSATDSDTILVPQADVTITKTDNTDEEVVGSTVTYFIVATNAGPEAAPSVTIADTFASTLTGCSTICIGSGGGTCAPGTIFGNLSDNAVLPVGGTVTYAATCTISPDAFGELVNTATATVGGGAADPDTSDNSSTDTDLLNAIFRDGFESGDTTAWSATEPPLFAIIDSIPVGAADSDVTFQYDLSAVRPGRVLGSTPIAMLADAGGRTLAQVTVRRLDASAPLEIRLEAANGSHGEWMPVDEAQGWGLRIEWTVADANNLGYLSLTLDGLFLHGIEGFSPANPPSVVRILGQRAASGTP